MQQAVPDLKEKCRLSNDIYDYHYVSQGKTSVPSIDDNEDLVSILKNFFSFITDNKA